MRRYESLDSLRGLAALSVVAWHSWPGSNGAPSWAQWPPLSLLWSGHSAVILFFVLSGFVLSLPYFEGRAQPYVRFIARRAFRLYPLFAVAILAAAAWALVLAGRPAIGGGFVASPGTTLREYLPMLASYRYDTVDGPLWSLVHEARISIILPLVVFASARVQKPKLAAALLAVISILSFSEAIALPTGQVLKLGAVEPFDSLAYLPMFVAGIYLARNRERAASWYRSYDGRSRAVFAGACLAVFGCWTYLAAVWELFVTVAACGLILIALAEPAVQPFLRWRPLVAIGAASYSVYLLHPLVLYPANLLLAGRAAWPVILVCCWAMIVPLALAAHRWIELPMIALGRRLTATETNSGLVLVHQGGPEPSLAKPRN